MANRRIQLPHIGATRRVSFRGAHYHALQIRDVLPDQSLIRGAVQLCIDANQGVSDRDFQIQPGSIGEFGLADTLSLFIPTDTDPGPLSEIVQDVHNISTPFNGYDSGL
jgi:hypothetical protein